MVGEVIREFNDVEHDNISEGNIFLLLFENSMMWNMIIFQKKHYFFQPVIRLETFENSREVRTEVLLFECKLNHFITRLVAREEFFLESSLIHLKNTTQTLK